MTRTLSLADDETGIAVSLQVEADQRVTRVVVEALGGGTVTPQSLLMLADIGFPLPRPVNADTSPAVAAKPASKPLPKETRTRHRHSGPRPTDEELLALYVAEGGVLTHMARSVGCHQTTMGTWVKAAQARGTVFEPVEPAKVPE